MEVAASSRQQSRWERRLRRRATGCGFRGRKTVGGTHFVKGNYRGWQGDIPICHTSVNGGLQLMTQQLPTLAPEEVQQSASMDPTPDLCKALQRKTTYRLQQPNEAIFKKVGECLNKNTVHALICRVTALDGK